jgi:hypothetical protein
VPEPDADRIDVSRFRDTPRRPKPAASAPAAGSRSEVDAAELKSLASTSESLARVVPAIVLVLALFASGAAFLRMLGGRRGATPHVRLELLALPGQPAPKTARSQTALFEIDTEPAGLVVFHEQRILGKTPCAVELPVAISGDVGVRLSGPRFEGWMAEVGPSRAGIYRVHAELQER